MKSSALLLVVFCAVHPAPIVRGDGLKVATICSGAATLNNGSIVILGQPFVGVMSAPGGAVSLSSGLLPAMLQEKNASGPLVITPVVSLASGRFQFCFPTQPGRNYVVQASTNLSSWTPVWTNPGTWTGLIFEDADAGQFPQRFYKVVAP